MKVLVEVDLSNPESAEDLLISLRHAWTVLETIENGVALRRTVQDPENMVDISSELGKAREIVGKLCGHIVAGGLKSFV